MRLLKEKVELKTPEIRRPSFVAKVYSWFKRYMTRQLSRKNYVSGH